MSRRGRLLLRVLGCSLLTFGVGVTVAWRQLPVNGLGELPPLPQTLNGWGALGAAVSFCVAMGVWAAKGLLAIARSGTPPNGQTPVGAVNTLLQDSATTLALLEEQRRTLRDLTEAFSASRQGQERVAAAVERLAEVIQKRGAA